MSAGGIDRLRPVTDDHDTGGYWAAARRGELVVRTCGGCSAPLHLPTAHCGWCGSSSSGWRPVRGRGRLYSWTVVTHQVHPAFIVPYTLVLVELEDPPGVRLVGSLAGAPDLVAGQPMEVLFEDLGEGAVVPNWRPLSS